MVCVKIGFLIKQNGDDSVHANVPGNGHKRVSKSTAKAAEEKMNRFKNQRQGKLAQLNRKTNDIDRLMQDKEDAKRCTECFLPDLMSV